MCRSIAAIVILTIACLSCARLPGSTIRKEAPETHKLRVVLVGEEIARDEVEKSLEVALAVIESQLRLTFKPTLTGRAEGSHRYRELSSDSWLTTTALYALADGEVKTATLYVVDSDIGFADTGVAGLAMVCGDPAPVAVVAHTSSLYYNALLIAHELGHILCATHSETGIMMETLDFVFPPDMEFDEQSREEVASSFRSRRTLP